MTQFDPRLTPARDDLAADFLRNHVKAQNYVAGVSKQVRPVGNEPAQGYIGPGYIKPCTSLLKYPRADAPRETELLYGEEVLVFEDSQGWSWVQSQRDDYVGYTPSQNLTLFQEKTTHSVSVLRTFVFSEPDIKSTPTALVSMNSPLKSLGEEGRFLKIQDGFIIADHVRENGVYSRDFVDVAHHFLGTPYLWGGRTSLGLDCSALVQNALASTGVHVPRDTDMQEKSVGEEVGSELANVNLQRGDFIFWKGHIGIMLDETDMIHANGTWMQVTINPVAEFAEHVLAQSGPVTSIRRL